MKKTLCMLALAATMPACTPVNTTSETGMTTNAAPVAPPPPPAVTFCFRARVSLPDGSNQYLVRAGTGDVHNAFVRTGDTVGGFTVGKHYKTTSDNPRAPTSLAVTRDGKRTIVTQNKVYVWSDNTGLVPRDKM